MSSTRDKLTLKQKAFADFYIECGNATEAAIKAGYNQKSARVIGCENLTKPAISAYIGQRMEQIENERIASGEEVLKYLTSVMRGEEKDQFGLDASLQDRTKAAELLGKRYRLFTDKVEVKDDGETERIKAINGIATLVQQMVPVREDDVDE